MDAATIGLLGGLSGILLGAFLTYFLDRRKAVSSRLHESRIDAYKLFATAVMEYRRAVMDQWFEDHEIDRPAGDSDVHNARSSAWAAYYGFRLVTGNDNLSEPGRELLEFVTTLKDLPTRDELNKDGERCREKVDEFVEMARKDVMAGSPR